MARRERTYIHANEGQVELTFWAGIYTFLLPEMPVSATTGVMLMVEEKTIREEEAKIKKIVDEANDKLMAETDGKPYLLVLTTLHEIEREGGKSKLAANWNWRSNIDGKKEGRTEKEIDVARTLIRYLLEQLKSVADHPESGIRKKYGLD